MKGYSLSNSRFIVNRQRGSSLSISVKNLPLSKGKETGHFKKNQRSTIEKTESVGNKADLMLSLVPTLPAGVMSDAQAIKKVYNIFF